MGAGICHHFAIMFSTLLPGWARVHLVHHTQGWHVGQGWRSACPPAGLPAGLTALTLSDCGIRSTLPGKRQGHGGADRSKFAWPGWGGYMLVLAAPSPALASTVREEMPGHAMRCTRGRAGRQVFWTLSPPCRRRRHPRHRLPAVRWGLPGSLRTLALPANRLYGPAQGLALPASLQTLNLRSNELSGAFAPEAWSGPTGLASVALDNNQLTSLPANLSAGLTSTTSVLTLAGNRISGGLANTTLGPSLLVLDLRWGLYASAPVPVPTPCPDTRLSSTKQLAPTRHGLPPPLPPQRQPAGWPGCGICCEPGWVAV